MAAGLEPGDRDPDRSDDMDPDFTGYINGHCYPTCYCDAVTIRDAYGNRVALRHVHSDGYTNVDPVGDPFPGAPDPHLDPRSYVQFHGNGFADWHTHHHTNAVGPGRPAAERDQRDTDRLPAAQSERSDVYPLSRGD
jgi:hypothetical protein